MNQDTIFALSTAWGKSGIAIIRLSGPSCKSISKHLFGKKNLIPRKAHYTEIYDHQKKLIDKGMVVFFKEPYSFTGEDMLEIHIHGSIAIVKKLIKELNLFKKLKPAEPGEFSKRSFFNNKINMIEAEGINNLVNSETESQRKIFLNQSYGKSLDVCNEWKKNILNISAMIDATIEFANEDEDILNENVKDLIQKIIKQIRDSIKTSNLGTKIRNGFNVLILGPPNAGKSTLFNFINKEEMAIITSEAGTTRDLITSSLEINGYKLNFIDSAGIRMTNNNVEKIGISKTKKKACEVDRLILVLSPDCLNTKNIKELNKLIHGLKKKKLIVIFNKNDLNDFKKKKEKWLNEIKGLEKCPNLSISCTTNLSNSNIEDKVYKFITRNLIEDASRKSEDCYFTEVRQIEHLKKCLRFLKSGYNLYQSPDLCAEEIRLALKEIENIKGNTDKEEKLDLIFSKFCIGK